MIVGRLSLSWRVAEACPWGLGLFHFGVGGTLEIAFAGDLFFGEGRVGIVWKQNVVDCDA